MELLSGRTLADRLKDGALPAPAALLACAQVASALAAAHSAGLVHRDVKPSNVMLTPAGVKVLDFGLAAEAGAVTESSLDGEVLGTPAYLAPERLTAGDVVPASDVYGLGLLLYTAMTGRLPWRAETISEMLAAHRYAEPAPLPASIGVPRYVRTLYQRCLAKDPRERPSAHEMATGLAEATLRRRRGRFWAALAVANAAPLPDHETRVVRTAVPVAAAREPASTNRWGAVALAGSVAVVAAALVGGLLVPVDESLLPDGPAPAVAAPDPAASQPVPPDGLPRANAGASALPGMPGPEDMVGVTTSDDAEESGGAGSSGEGPEVSEPAPPGSGANPAPSTSTPGPSSPPPTGTEPSPDPEPSPSPSPSPGPVQVLATVDTVLGPLQVQCTGDTVSLLSEPPAGYDVDPGPGSQVSIGGVVVVRCESGAPVVALGVA
jgi:serine/threonine-protein kinase